MRVARQARRVGVSSQQCNLFFAQEYFPSKRALEFHAAARLADKDGGPTQIGMGGARGGGKSHTVFAQAMLDDAQRYPGLTILYLRKVGKKAREQFETLRKDVLHHTPHKYNRSEGCIYLPNGSKCLIGGFISEGDIDDYLGLQYDIIVIEEHTALSLLKHRALRDCNRTSKPGWRPRIYSTTNPGGQGHAWYRDLFKPNMHKPHYGSDTVFIPATVEDNPYIDSGYTAKLEENTGWRLRAYRYGDWEIAAGQFFTTWNKERHVIDDLLINYHWDFWASMDYGFVHYNVIHLHCQTSEGIIYTFDEIGAMKRIPKYHAYELLAMLRRHGLELWRLDGIYAGGDIFSKDRDGKSPADDYERLLGVKVKRADMSRITGAAEMLNRLGDDKFAPSWFVHRRCARLIETMPAMEHDPRRPEDVLKVDCDEDGNGGDDFYDSARYGIMVKAGGRRISTGKSPMEGYRG